MNFPNIGHNYFLNVTLLRTNAHNNSNLYPKISIMEDMNKKDATLTMKLKAKSGYKSESQDNISPNQWKDINLVLAGKLSSEIINELVEALKDITFIFESLSDKVPTPVNEFKCYQKAKQAIEKALK